MQAVNNAIVVFDHANEQSQLLRRQQDTVEDFRRTIVEREADFTNRLIEVFGYPHAEDIGAGGTYPQGYDGPDIYHYDYVDPSELAPGIPGPVEEFALTLVELDVDAAGGLTETERDVVFHVSTDGLGLVKPSDWSRRRAQGEIQLARSEFLQSRGRFLRGLTEYDNLIRQIEDSADLLEKQHGLNASEIAILRKDKNKRRELNEEIADARLAQITMQRAASFNVHMTNAIVEGVPKVVGFSNDATSTLRAQLMMVGAVFTEGLALSADLFGLEQLNHEIDKEDTQAQTNIDITAARLNFAIEQQLAVLEQMVRSEAATRLELFTLFETMQQGIQRYLASVARGQRLLEDRLRFRKQTAAQIQNFRYRDMAFRIFRNDALQKYRAQFDMAAMYVYLAARAYDFETNLLGSDSRGPGQDFLAAIVKERTIGRVGRDGSPQTGVGLTDSMARMIRNWQVLESQLGFNNPQTETNRFSLRSELFRIEQGPQGDQVWRDTLKRHVVENLFDLPEFRRFARPFLPSRPVEPAIVIPFTTNVSFGLNFFGFPLGGGDSAYDSTNFATKVRSTGVWFAGYNNLGGGMSNTPRVYLVPVGNDILRTPTNGAGEIREWKVVEQKLPIPFPVSAGELEENLDWIPSQDTLSDDFADLQKHSSFRAFHDSGNFRVEETIQNSRLVGRSVWNTRWLLIIPAGTLHADRAEALARFVDGGLVSNGERDGNGVFDIKIFFQTYAYSGN